LELDCIMISIGFRNSRFDRIFVRIAFHL